MLRTSATALGDEQTCLSMRSCDVLLLLLQVRDFRNDVILAEACRVNVDQFCADITPGEGKVHQVCPLFHWMRVLLV